MIDMIKKIAGELGFDAVGVTRVTALEAGEKAISDWVGEGRHAGMKYMEEFPARRKKFYQDFPDARSVIVLGVNYYFDSKSEIQISKHETGAKVSNFEIRASDFLSGRVARYAWGKDYHLVIADRHQELIQKIHWIAGENFRAKSCVDTQPIPERFAAMRAGLGFSGKHTGLLNPQFGPWLFLSEIVTNLDLPEDKSSPGNCGACVDCQKICPTGALDQDYKIDAGLCIAYLTIEHKGIIPRELRPKIKNWIFGCDECFAVCPFTSKSKESHWSALAPAAGVGSKIDLRELFEIKTNSQYEKKFEGTALLRTSRKQMLRNACVVLGNSGKPQALPYIIKALQDPAPLVRVHAVWALGRLGLMESAEMLRKHQDEDSGVNEEIQLTLSDLKRI